MHRADAYRLLCTLLGERTRGPYDALARSVGDEPEAIELLVSGEPVEVEVWTQWHDNCGGDIKLTVVLNGPGTWHTARFVESAVVKKPTEASR